MSTGQRKDRRSMWVAGLVILAAFLLAACDTRPEPVRQPLSATQPASNVNVGLDDLAATQTSARKALATIQAANLTGTPCGTAEASGYVVIYDLFGSPTPSRTPTVTSTPRPAR